ncbi:glycogen debranching protein GlgX [Rapidithrix thailandica]|uniref:Glycogen debranching protein GlgX n=1 Tax=Rapidithrix thailandica TaxID=413964 RepID=A0AAW9RUL0_9BACT
MIPDMDTNVFSGRSYPLGATVTPYGVNFCIFSKNCFEMELLLFDSAESTTPSRIIPLHPTKNKTFYYWHVFVPLINSGQIYAYRASGPWNPEEGQRFNAKKVLLDPYSKAVVTPKSYSRKAAKHQEDNCAWAMKSVVVDTQTFDWQGDEPLHHPYGRSVIYELHVGGFTKHPNSGLSEQLRGTYLGLIEKIPYLKKLGITAVELLPVQQFDAQDAPPDLINYWGYSPVAFLAPHNGYCSSNDPLAPVNEFRTMVKALHKAGIEVILDVVFNHTAEGDTEGPTLSYRGLENLAYYTLDTPKSSYKDYSGCGNTLNANHSIVRRLIMDALRYWVSEMHIDGFRFDLASVLARDENGHPLENPPILWEIESDPVLAGTKIIAEAWDAGGLYQVGSFIGDKWSEWNGHYRDDIRCFVKGDPGYVLHLKNRIEGSHDIFSIHQRDPNRSINFITCHDGFTLNDLVSYNDKHNLKNNEDNRDGTNDNHSWNTGVEGPTENPQIEQLRSRQLKNFFTLLFFSQGTPMMLMGDEVRRTQYGNNNAYCHDNEINWFDWQAVPKNEGLLRFVKKLIRFNLEHEVFQEELFWSEQGATHRPRITWHGIKANRPDWGHNSHSIAFMLDHEEFGKCLYVMINAYWKPLTFQLPNKPNNISMNWRRIINTSLPSPEDFVDWEEAESFTQNHFDVQGRTIVVLMAN